MKHFGVTVQPGKYGLELCREKYGIINNYNSLGKFDELFDKGAYTDEEGTTYTDEWCKEYQQLILQNYDLNMRFFASLNHNEFQAELDNFLKENKSFVEVTNLTEYKGAKGYYIMVLDKYCQVYIGTTDDIKRRIQQHWTRNKYFDRLLFPMYAVNESVLSIDSFRSLDTTRIFASTTKRTYVNENKYINSFSPQYVTNRLGGGKLSGGLLGFIEAGCSMKSKKLD
ncbi:MAG: hypothetical protein IJO67_00920 [Clostridia bacterium]|nr:hypothetical protein [Clostridia bacterium]